MTMSFGEAVGFAPPVDNPVTLLSVSGTNIPAFNVYDSPVLDLRAYQSLLIRVELTGGTSLQTDPWDIDLTYYASSSTAASNATYLDSYQVFARSDLTINNRALYITDTVHGPFLRISANESLSPGRDTNINLRVLGSYRPMPNVFVRHNSRNGSRGKLFSARNIAMGAGTTISGNAIFGYGPAKVYMLSGAAGGATLQIQYGDSFLTERLVAAAANTFVEKMIVMPKSQMLVSITNNAAGAQDVAAQIIQQLTPI